MRTMHIWDTTNPVQAGWTPGRSSGARGKKPPAVAKTADGVRETLLAANSGLDHRRHHRGHHGRRRDLRHGRRDRVRRLRHVRSWGALRSR